MADSFRDDPISPRLILRFIRERFQDANVTINKFPSDSGLRAGAPTTRFTPSAPYRSCSQMCGLAEKSSTLEPKPKSATKARHQSVAVARSRCSAVSQTATVKNW